MATTVYVGDNIEVLKTFPDNHFQMVVTSPPYWGLRNYGMDGQLGLEPTPELYVGHLVEVFREVRRVLREDGTCWLNLGTSFISKRIESDEMVLRENLTPEERAYVFQALAKHETESKAVS